MRVVAGVARGRRLKAPAGRKLRPTTERVREAVFSSLTSLGVVQGAHVLDLFAGTGAMGIEALSRGAATATFVEADPAAAAVIEDNLANTGLVSHGTVVRADALRYVERLAREGSAPYDLAFVDPPYAFDQWPVLLGSLPATMAVLESSRSLEPGPGWTTVRSRRHGDTVVTIARRN